MTTRESHDRLANAIRFLAADAVEKANSGHPGLPMGAADVATVLFTRYLKFDPLDPHWPDRDRFVLSAGHGSMLLYSLLYLTGYEDMTIDQIENFRQLGSRTAGHPEYGHAAGIETTTGPLGQGIGNSVGMALAERILNAQFGDDLVNHRTYALCGDGCLMEGISQEALTLAGHLRLHKLTLFWDNNHISIDGAVSLADSTNQEQRFAASGWHTIAIDGHDPDAIANAIEEAQHSDRPTFIAARTTIGFGAPTRAGTNKAHGSPLGAEEIAGARKALDWPYPAFEVPSEILSAWRQAGQRSAGIRDAWDKRLAGAAGEVRSEFGRRIKGELPSGFDEAIVAYKQKLVADKPKVATRKASEMALEVVNAVVPETVGGSADLTGSNNTKTSQTKEIRPGDFNGRYVHYGVREHGMAAALNGMALHGGLIPYSGTFLVFSDYARPAMRLASLMGIRSIFVMSHDSIGLGEDGPTHQPVEQLASLRAIPGLDVIRPADANETAEAWRAAMDRHHQPVALVLTRQDVPILDRTKYASADGTRRGGYVLADAEGAPEVILIATGSEVALAVEAHEQLISEGISSRVVSMPCWELFERQEQSYQDEVLPPDITARVSVEEASTLGWDRFVGFGGAKIGMHTFGSSAPLKDVQSKFGFTPDKVAETAKEVLGR